MVIMVSVGQEMGFGLSLVVMGEGVKGAVVKRLDKGSNLWEFSGDKEGCWVGYPLGSIVLVSGGQEDGRWWLWSC